MTKKTKTTKKTKKPTTKKKKKAQEFKFVGRMKKAIPVVVIWDDAFHDQGAFPDAQSLEDACCGPILSESFGRLYYASKSEIILAHFNHLDSDGKITSVRFPFRIATPMILEIINLRTDKTLYLRKDARRKK